MKSDQAGTRLEIREAKISVWSSPFYRGTATHLEKFSLRFEIFENSSKRLAMPCRFRETSERTTPMSSAKAPAASRAGSRSKESLRRRGSKAMQNKTIDKGHPCLIPREMHGP